MIKIHHTGFTKLEGKPMANKCAYFAPIYEPTSGFPILAMSMLEQQNPDWELYAVYDGPSNHSSKGNSVKKFFQYFDDPRIHFEERAVRQGHYGHPLRHEFLQRCKSGEIANDCDSIVITNQDNYHTPIFNHFLLASLQGDYTVSFSDEMCHNYFSWNIVKIEIQLAKIDISAMMIRKDIACEIGWPWLEHSSDWTFIDSISSKYGNESFCRVPGCLVVHN